MEADFDRWTTKSCSSLVTLTLTNGILQPYTSLRKVMIYLLTSCNTEERIAQNIYIHNSNRNIKKKKDQLQEQF